MSHARKLLTRALLTLTICCRWCWCHGRASVSFPIITNHNPPYTLHTRVLHALHPPATSPLRTYTPLTSDDTAALVASPSAPNYTTRPPQLTHPAAAPAHCHKNAVSILVITPQVESEILAPHSCCSLRLILFRARHAAPQHQPPALHRQTRCRHH